MARAQASSPRAAEPFESTRHGRAYRKITGTKGNRYAAGSRGKRTWYQHASSVGLFEAWCAEHDLQPMPASTDTLLRYLVHLADEGYAYATVLTYLNGIAAWHAAGGHPLDRRPLHATLKGIAREAPRSRQARPLLVQEVQGILALLDAAQPVDARDGALLCVGLAGALRPSEAAGLDWRQRGAGPAKGTGTLRLTARGIDIVLHESKTSPLADDRVPPIPAADAPSAVTWVKAWRELAGIEPGTPLFRTIGKRKGISEHRLPSPAITDIVRARIRQLASAQGATEPQALRRSLAYSGHSLRHGLGTSQARAGVQEWRIRRRMRHKSANTTARYIQAVETWTDTALSSMRF